MGGPLLYTIFIIGSVLVLASVIWFTFDLQKTKKLLRKADKEKNELQSIISDAEMMVDELNNFSNYLLTKIEQKNNEAGVVIEKLDESLSSLRLGHAAEEPVRKNPPGLSRKKYTGKRRSAPTYGDDAGMGAPPVETGMGAPPVLSLRPPSRNLTDDLDALPVLSLRPPSRNLTDDRSVESEIIETADNDGVSVVQYEEQSGQIHTGRRYKSRMIKRYVGQAGSAQEAHVATYPDAAGLVPDTRRNERYGATAPRSKKNLEVLRCHEEGLGEAAIAKRMNIGRGEVALILGLHENGAAQLNHGNG